MKTELELNTELAELLGMRVATVNDPPYGSYGDNTSEDIYQDYRERYPNTVWALADGEPWEQFIFTRDWSQLMPIVVKLGIEYRKDNPDYYNVSSRFSNGFSNTLALEADLQIALVKACIKLLKGGE